MPGDLCAGERDLRFALAVEPLAALDPRRRATRSPRAAGRTRSTRRAVAQLLQVDLVLDAPQPRAPCASPGRAVGERSSSRITRSGRNSSRCRRRIVTRRSTSSSREKPVAAARPPRREQALVLEIADLRDRDVGELVPKALAHGPDRVQARGRHLVRSWCSSAQERHPVFADLHLVVVFERRPIRCAAD